MVLGKEWEKTEGVVDTENSYDVICARAVDCGISISYVINGELYIVDVSGIFDICPMTATGYTTEQIREMLPPGTIAVPIMLKGVSRVLTINSDYEMTVVDEEDVVANGIIDLDNVEECVDPDEADEDLVQMLGIV